jgi:Transcription elongation factor, GreA/GreB, C-term
MGTSLADERPAEPGGAPAEVEVGMHVEVELVGESGEAERLALDIVPDDEADFSAGFLGISTPLSRAMLGRRAGSVVPYRAGDIREIRILSVAASARPPSEDVAASREAILQKAVTKSDMADTVRFALSVDTKWGGYDPSGIAPEWE